VNLYRDENVLFFKKKKRGKKEMNGKEQVKKGNSRQDLPGTMYGGGSSQPL
jgi:hypothetical protein